MGPDRLAAGQPDDLRQHFRVLTQDGVEIDGDHVDRVRAPQAVRVPEFSDQGGLAEPSGGEVPPALGRGRNVCVELPYTSTFSKLFCKVEHPDEDRLFVHLKLKGFQA